MPLKHKTAFSMLLKHTKYAQMRISFKRFTHIDVLCNCKYANVRICFFFGEKLLKKNFFFNKMKIVKNQIQQFSSLRLAIKAIGGPCAKIIKSERVFGGDINKAYALTLQNKEKIFMKANKKENAHFFTAEASGLLAIASAQKIATPKILATGTDDENGTGFSFLLLEFIQSAPPEKNYWANFGRALAAMHKAECAQFVENGKCGFVLDKFIENDPLKNCSKKTWIEFFREIKLVPQFERASHWFDNSFRKKIDSLLKKLDAILIEPEKPSLLHGDLWRGNAMCGADGKAVLIDPTAYVGFYETDLALTELFGGFARDFYEGYWEETPKIPGYENRRDIYNLFPLLNHLNLFGAGYLGAVKQIVLHYAD